MGKLARTPQNEYSTIVPLLVSQKDTRLANHKEDIGSLGEDEHSINYPAVEARARGDRPRGARRFFLSRPITQGTVCCRVTICMMTMLAC